ncbi:MAG: aminotransferase class III-fold pyridoxal phosphate-dependent enzyme, partial [Planctomycetota bacterium]|nr:aminotransferase class III-fold pyridoxal phosphate-dependent enzyme [Planctomycetota bacterium]
MDIFDRLESNVRGYCRAFPTVFETASGHTMIDESGREYIDFFAGAGSLNYGHNHPVLKRRLIEYLSGNGIVHSLDMATSAKRRFLDTFEEVILQPRNLDYKVMFAPGPTGTNSVEAALKLARKVTGRHNIVSFTNGFHGMTLGSLALTGNSGKRAGAGVPLSHVSHMPYCDYLGTEADTIAQLERFLEDSSSGLDLPA